MLCVSKQPEQIRVISSSECMNRICINQNLQLSLCFQRNHIYLINSSNQVLSAFKSHFDFYSGYKKCFSKYCNGYQAVFNPELYNPVIFNGKIYIQCFNHLYVLEQNKLHKLLTIPDMYLDDFRSFFGHIFVFNNNLFVHGSKGSLFQLQNDKLILFKTIHSAQFFQFNESVYIQTDNCIFKLQKDFEYKLVCKCENAEIKFCTNGFLGFRTSAGVEVLNMKSEQVVIISKNEANMLGVEVIIQKLFSNEQINEIRKDNIESEKKMMENEEYKKMVQYYLKFNVVFPEQKKQFNNQIDRVNQQLENTMRRINRQKELIYGLTETMISKLLLTSSCLCQFINNEASQ
ncbi:Conserved_hypothetical protein [Hexamita inflata]|uniref:Uncharacterized protein n=1 Tax=Hexamita inflata TaxID=28002 RepID=A0AA86QMN6_9EUKA|nr:Conserved hypothetical protein [Hexamita inflata]